jgi:hypothetical protein
MKTRSLETALAILSSVQVLAAVPDLSGIYRGSPTTPTTPTSTTALSPVPPSPAPLISSNHPIQQITLDPLQVIQVPVATDRLTTLRFPSPVSDLASALISTEPHPSAHFQMTFHPGESFFSVRALRANASTTLNVVWKSQTFVFHFHESSDPWLSVILGEPVPIRPNRSAVPKTRTHPTPANPADKYLDVARNLASLRRQYPLSMADVDQIETRFERRFNGVVVRMPELLHFKTDRVGVARIILSNPGNAPVDLGTNPIQLRRQGQPLRLLGSNFDGTLPALGERIALVAFQFPSGEVIRDPTDFQIVVPALEPASARSKP